MEFWLNKANEQDYIPAKFALGELYCFGYVSEKKKIEYINEYILPVAEQGYAEAQIYLGKFYIAQKDIQKGIEWYTKAAENENIEAQNYLANAYFYGDKVAKDYDKAFYWFKKATKSHFCGNFVDYGDSLYHLGLSYLYGLGVGANQEKAVKLFTLASKHKNPKADFCLSLCYENGLGVNQDYEKAFKSYLESANKGVAYSQSQLGSCYENGYGVVKDYKKAFEWYTKAANQGETMAQGHLGEFYEKGYYVTKNIVKAVELYTKASWHEDADRLRRLYNLPADNRKYYI